MLQKYLTLVLIVLFSLQGFSQQKYSLDSKQSQERKIFKEKRKNKPREIRFQDRKIRKTQKRTKRLDKRSERQHKRAVKKHNTRINGGGKDLVTGQKVNKRMRKSRREAKRINSGKNPVPWYKRLFK